MKSTAHQSIATELSVRLKFSKSTRTNNLVAHIRNTNNNVVVGSKESSGGTRVVVAHRSISSEIIPGILYNCKIRPMQNNGGFVAIQATPVEYKCHIDLDYLPRTIYKVIVKWGKEKLVFDPVDGREEWSRDIEKACDKLRRRLDISNKEQIIAEFIKLAKTTFKLIEKDGVSLRKFRRHGM